jgi:hypothetical protein
MVESREGGFHVEELPAPIFESDVFADVGQTRFKWREENSGKRCEVAGRRVVMWTTSTTNTGDMRHGPWLPPADTMKK